MMSTAGDDRSDVMTPLQRSRCMSRIRGRDTKPEIMLRKVLWGRGYRYRVNSRLPGRPDIIFPGRKVAVFVDGCFWHGCPEHRVMPRQNAEFWKVKLETNQRRDTEVNEKLAKLDWRVIRVWEHEIKSDVQKAADRVEAFLVD